MNGPDPDAVAWLEDPDRLAHQRALEPDGPHVCDEQCRPTSPARSPHPPSGARPSPPPPNTVRDAPAPPETTDRPR
jgi:hypothetical protein